MQAILKDVGKRTMNRYFGSMVAKAGDPFEEEMYRLLVRYGMLAYDDGGKRASKSAGAKWSAPPGILAEMAATKGNKVVLLIKDTEDEVRRALDALMAQSATEYPRPSVKEVARRIARQWFGPEAIGEIGRGTEREAQMTADWRRTTEQIEGGGREHLFSFERAYTIARTETAQAENLGIKQGYTDAGVDKVKWLAYPDDGRSGKRMHWKMNKHPPIDVVDMNNESDSSGWFTLPSGWKTPYPNWMGLPAGETVNCRCTIVPA